MSQRISGHTELIGLIAKPIRHSKSPAIHNEAFEYLGLDYAYLVFEIDKEDVEDAIKGMRALGIKGSNVSMPYKTEVMQYLDEIDPVADLCNSVNTIVNKDGHLKGYCTDGVGFMMSLKDKGIDVIGKKMTIAGAGGAATAIVIQAALDGVASISVFNRKNGSHWGNAEDTVRKVKERTNCDIHLYDLNDTQQLRKEMADSTLFVNATSVGMKAKETLEFAKDPSFFRPELNVVDIIYANGDTELLHLASKVGCTTMNGESLLLFQGAAAFELWTGHKMPIEHMKKDLGIE